MADIYNNKVVLGDGTVLMDISGDTIEPSDVINKKTFHDKSGAPKTGTCTYDMDTSEGDALASEILAGKKAGVGGQMLTGTMPNNGAQVGKITTKAQKVAIKNGAHDGSGYVTIDEAEQAKIIAANILKGVKVLGVEGTLEPSSSVMIEPTKSVTPSFVEQQITPSEGYNAMAQVNVAAIKIATTLNAAGGYTLTIG